MLARLFQIAASVHCINCNAYGSRFCGECRSQVILPSARCYRCNRLSENFRTCSPCRSSTPIYSLKKSAYYEGVTRRLIVESKFGPNRSSAVAIGHIVAGLLTSADKVDVITSVPTDTRRRRQRGYDHAKLIGQTVAGEIGLPYEQCLYRLKHSQQTGADRLTRRRQMESLFSPVNTAPLAGKRVLLVDDVVSTGASVEAAAKVLKQSGATRISVAVAAHNR